MTLDTLTPEQEAMLPVVRDEWLCIGLSTEPANRPAAEAAARLAYERAGLPAPSVVLWLRSPMEGAIAAAQVGAQVRAQVGAQVGASLWGQHDAGWLGWIDAFARLGIDVSRADGLIGVARNSGWWWAFSDVVILTERPLVLHRDDRGRLHAESGPAIAYPDGFGIWAWHGVRVPQRIIEQPETITVADIDAEQNAEIRRVMIERYGMERFVRDAGARMAGRDDWGTLWVRDMPGDDPLVVVEVVNSTPEPDGTSKRYTLRVPPEFGGKAKTIRVAYADDGEGDERRVPRTPHAAIAWTFRLDPEAYVPAVMS